MTQSTVFPPLLPNFFFLTNCLHNFLEEDTPTALYVLAPGLSAGGGHACCKVGKEKRKLVLEHQQAVAPTQVHPRLVGDCLVSI